MPPDRVAPWRQFRGAAFMSLWPKQSCCETPVMLLPFLPLPCVSTLPAPSTLQTQHCGPQQAREPGRCCLPSSQHTLDIYLVNNPEKEKPSSKVEGELVKVN